MRVANNRDVLTLFGESTIQASTLQSGEHRVTYRLVGLSHELHAWQTPHTSCSPMADQFEREYSPDELFPSENWIKGVWEPLRDAQYNGRPMQPPAMTFMMQESPLRDNAEVAVLLGLHQKMGGPYKLVYVFRRYKCVHVYECISHGREWWFSLHLTTDSRYCLHSMQPSTKSPIKADPPSWWLRGAGLPYPTKGPAQHLWNDITDYPNRSPTESVVVVRDASHPENLSGGPETYIPARLLHGLIPSCLFEAYHFYQDESNRGDMRGNGVRRLRGYPKDEDATRTIVFVDFGPVGSWETEGSSGSSGRSTKRTKDIRSFNDITGMPGRSVRVHRRSKIAVEREFKQLSMLASIIESAQLLSVKKGSSSRTSGGLDDLFRDGDEDEDEEIVPKFKEGEHLMCFENRYLHKWLEAYVTVIKADDEYDIQFNSNDCYDTHEDVDARTRMRKVPKGSSTKAMMGEGVWTYASMSDSENADWQSDEEGTKDGDDRNGSEDRVRSKKKLTFRQFWLLPQIVRSCRGDAKLCGEIMRRIAEEVTRNDELMFESVKTLAEYVRDHPDNVGGGDTTTTKDEVRHQLLNLMYAPRRSRLHSISKTLCRVEDLSHILPWTRVPDDDEERSRVVPQGKTTWGCPQLDAIEFPRLKLTLSGRKDSDGTLRLFSVDHADLFVSNTRDTRAIKLLEGVPHSLILQNSQGEMHILVPVVRLVRPIVESRPFSTRLVLVRGDTKWNRDTSGNSLTQRYFLYPIHISMSFLMTKGLDSALYLLNLRLLARNYATTFRLADAVATDTKFSSAGGAIWRQLSQAGDDCHPDAHATRLKLSLVTIDSGEAYPWELTYEASGYVTKMTHVSAECRISRSEELQLLSDETVVVDRLSPKYADLDIYGNKYDLYRCTLVKNRKSMLDVLADASASSFSSSSDDSSSADESFKAKCWVPPGEITSGMWPYYQDNTVFGEKYNEVVSVDTKEEFATVVCDGFASLTLLCLHVKWSNDCVRVIQALEAVAPTLPFVRFVTIRADHFELASVMEKLESSSGDWKEKKKNKVKKFPTFILLRGKPKTDTWEELARWEGHARASERINATVAEHFLDPVDVDNHVLREEARVLREKESGDYDSDEEEEDDGTEGMEMQWIWNTDQMGGNMVLTNYGMSVEFLAENTQNDPLEVVWQWAWKNNKYQYDATAKWQDFDEVATEKLEEHWTSGGWYQQGPCSIQTMLDNIKGNWSVYHNSTDISKAGLATGWYCQNSGGENRNKQKNLWMVRRKGLLADVSAADVPSHPQPKAHEKAGHNKARREAIKKKEMMTKMMLKRRNKDAHVARGAHTILKNSGMHTWTLVWKHHPSRGDGSFDCVGVCAEEYVKLYIFYSFISQ